MRANGIKYFLLIFMLTGCIMNMSINTSIDRKANFKKYKKYAWSPNKYIHKTVNQKYDNDIIESNIQTAVMNELNDRGLRLDTANPDIILDFDIMTEKKVRQDFEPIYRSSPYYYNGFSGYSGYNYGNSYYNYGGWNNYNNMGYGYTIDYRTVNTPYKEGTVIIDVVDAALNKLVFKGYATGELTDPSSFESELQLDIHKIFDQFPIKVVTKKE
jgi:hypothetical protein